LGFVGLGWVGFGKVGLGWVDILKYQLGWVVLGPPVDGLGWIGSHKMDPWTTLRQIVYCSIARRFWELSGQASIETLDHHFTINICSREIYTIL